MTEITRVARAFLQDRDYQFDFEEEPNSFNFGLRLDNGNVGVRIICYDDKDFFMVFAFWRGKLPVKNIANVLPVINDINFSTRFTVLTVDPEDGELACHAGVNTDGLVEITPDMIGATLHMCVTCLDDNIDKIMQAAWNAPTTGGQLN